MGVKSIYYLEYILNASPKVLYNRISTAGGLSEWFADGVEANGNIFKFRWEKAVSYTHLTLPTKRIV